MNQRFGYLFSCRPFRPVDVNELLDVFLVHTLVTKCPVGKPLERRGDFSIIRIAAAKHWPDNGFKEGRFVGGVFDGSGQLQVIEDVLLAAADRDPDFGIEETGTEFQLRRYLVLSGLELNVAHTSAVDVDVDLAAGRFDGADGHGVDTPRPRGSRIAKTAVDSFLPFPTLVFLERRLTPKALVLCEPDNEFDDKLIWLYNKTLHKIQNFDPNYYFQNKTGSSIYEFYQCNLPEEYFYEICWRLFYIEPKSYYLLVGELDWLDNNLNLNDNKFNNLKFNIFLGVLEQFKISSQSEIFDWFNSLIDLLNPPNPKSIKFSIYMGLYVYNKLLDNNQLDNKLLDNNQLDNRFININYDDSNINKFFTLLTLLDSKTFTTIFEYVDKLNNDIFINKNNNDINEIFDNNDNFIETPYDYKLKNKNNYLYDEVNKNEIKFNHIIEVYGGGNNTDIKIPINPLNKIAKYIYYIKQNISRTM